VSTALGSVSDAPVDPAGSAPLLELRSLSKSFTIARSFRDVLGRRPGRQLRAVREVSLSVREAQVLAVVGETGSGKTTLGRLILRLEKPDSGDVLIEGRSVLGLAGNASARLRREVQVILQDPYSALNPYRTVAQTMHEVLSVHGIGAPAERDDEVVRLLQRVGFPPDMRDRRPGQLSGGGRQRVSIARALAVGPRLIVADEPVSALDVSVQAQVLNLFEELRRDLGLTFVFITHDLAVVRRLADTIAVMYLGEVVEQAPADELFEHPRHPYTQALLAAAPQLGVRRADDGPAAAGDMPDPADPPAGCPFHTRCPSVMDVCVQVRPQPVAIGAGTTVSCHLYPGSPAPARPTDPPTPRRTP
jgi:oligopeptide/dipeptide ABC transporter ATP-binding protein